MINQDKINIYRRYNGDIDSWARSGSKKEKITITNDDWYTIDSLVQDLSLSKKGLTSSNYDQELKNRLHLLCSDEKTINELRSLL
jgi:hypothetical protein